MYMNQQDKSCDKAPVHIDVDIIPQYTQECLARATLAFIQRILSQPGGREALDRKIAELGL